MKEIEYEVTRNSSVDGYELDRYAVYLLLIFSFEKPHEGRIEPYFLEEGVFLTDGNTSHFNGTFIGRKNQKDLKLKY